MANGQNIISENQSLFEDEEKDEQEQSRIVPEGSSLFEDEQEDSRVTIPEGSRLVNEDESLFEEGSRTEGIQAPQTRFESGMHAFVQGLGDLPTGLMQGISAVSHEIGQGIDTVAEAAGGDFTSPHSVEDHSLYRAGSEMRGYLEEAFPENPEFQGEFLASVLPRGFGTFATQAAAAGLTGGLSVGAQVGAQAAVTGIGFSGLEYDEALQQTGDEDTAFQTMLLNIPVNTLEQLPVMAAMGRMNRATGGGWNRILSRAASTRTGVGVIEGTQEIAQEFSQNLIASNMYDESRDLLTGLDKAGGAGFIIGMTARTIGIQFRKVARDPSSTPQQKAEAINTLEFLNEETRRLMDRGRLQGFGPIEFEFTRRPEDTFSLKGQDPTLPPLADQRTQEDLEEQLEARRSGEITGNILEFSEGTGAFRIQLTSPIREQLRGKGHGTHLYMRLLWKAKQEGRLLLSDFTVEDPARRVYDAMERRGVPMVRMEENPEDVADFLSDDATDQDIANLQSGSKFALDPRNVPDDVFPAEIREGAPFRPGSRVPPRDVFDPDIIPDAQEFINREEIGVSQEEQSIQDVSEEQSTVRIRPKDETVWQRTKTKLKHWLAPSGKFPTDLFNTMFEVGDLNRHTKQMSFVMRDMSQALREEFDVSRAFDPLFSEKVPKSAMDNLSNFMRGEEDVDILPESMQEPAKRMRNHIDELSRTLIKSGFTEGEIDVTIKENIGKYIHRTYKLHNQPDWAEQVPEGVKRRAAAFLRRELPDQLQNEQQARNLVERILYKEDTSPIRALRGAADVKGIDLSPLMKRGEIPDVIRELMGEETNPIVNYVNSITSVANMIQQQRTFQELATQFKGEYFFEPDDPNIPEDAKALVADQGNDRYRPLDGLYTTPEIKQALTDVEESFGAQNSLFRGYLMANAAAKFSKTVLNPTTISRNVIGGSFFLFANGINPFGPEMKTAMEAAKSAFVNPDTEVGRQQILEYAELNLLGSSPQAGEINDLVGDLSRSEDYAQLQIALAGKGFMKKTGRAIKKASDFYQAGDNFLRIVFYENELKRRRRIHENDDMTEQEIKQEAAQVTNELYQNYDFVPKAIRELRKAPISPFIAFQYEMARTTTNLVKRIKKEINSSNPEERRVGYQRLFGSSVVGGATLAASLASKALLGIGDEEEEDIRRFAAPWDEDATLIFLNSDRGETKFLNGSYIDPYEYLKDPVINALTGRGEDNFFEGVKNGLFNLMEPVLQPEIFTNKAVEVAFNTRRDTGTDLWNPEDGLGVKVGKMVAHLFEGIQPGFLRSGRRIYETIDEDQETRNELSTEILALFGTRITTIDFDKGLDFKVRDYRERKRNARKQYNSVKFDESASQSEVQRAFQESNESYREAFQEMARDLDAAERKGLSWFDMKDKLVNSGLSEAEVERLRFERFQQFER